TDVTFDIIILSDILEHLPDDTDILKIAGENSKYILLNLPLEKCYEFRNRKYGPDDCRGHLRSYNLYDAKRLIQDSNLKVLSSTIEYYVKKPVFRRYLWTKLVKKRNGIEKLRGSIRYFYEMIEIFLRYKNYKSNFFALLKSAH
ncbi:MAG: hypothetical protein HY738_04950, partial [Bacteroidia bacterium]|nr:hypothetical protein [Bacteroidia bacterium]